MIQIKLVDVWENLVDYYYKYVQPLDMSVSIWDFVEKEYHGKRTYKSGIGHHNIQFIFNNDIDATAFKLKFQVTEHI